MAPVVVIPQDYEDLPSSQRKQIIPIWPRPGTKWDDRLLRSGFSTASRR